MSREDDRNGFVVIKWIAIAVFSFFAVAIMRGKSKELVFTTGILLLTWWLMSFVDWMSPIFYWIPFIHYAIYWVYVLIFKKQVRVYSTCEHWGDKNWWWSLNGWQFEEEVAKVFQKNGYEASVTKKTGDGGVDIIMYKDKKKYIVQCKHYTDPIPVSYMRELNGIRDDFKADELIMVASSGGSIQCENFIDNKPYFTLLDLDDIMELGADYVS